MPIITPSTFRPLRSYGSVLLGQQLPLVDADINEESAIRRFQQQSALKWLGGNGTPVGQDNALSLQASGALSDFLIVTGTPALPDALETTGRCFVNGLEVLLTQTDFLFSSQPLHSGQPGALALSALWGVPEISMPPAADETVAVFIDVWDRTVTADEDPSLIHPALGIESSARTRQEFAIRVRPGTTAPVAGDADFLAGHNYLAIATITRRLADSSVNPEDLTDLRRRQIAFTSQLTISQMVADSFGPAYALDSNGTAQLPFSMREIINSMLADGRPATIGPRPINNTSISYIFPASEFAADGTQWISWVSGTAVPGTFELQVVRQTDATVPAAQTEFSFPGSGVFGTALAAQPDGAMWSIYAVFDGSWEVRARRHFGGVWEPEVTLANTDTNDQPVAATNAAGEILVVWRNSSAAGFELQSRVIQPGGALTPILTAAPASPTGFSGHSLSLDNDDSFLLYTIEDTGPADWPMQSKRFSGGWAGAFDLLTNTNGPVGFLQSFSAVRDASGADWLFWIEFSAGSSTFRARRVQGTDVFAVRQLATGILPGATAVRDPSGNIQAIFHSINDMNRLFLVFSI